MIWAGGRSPSPFAAALACRCPRCGQGRLFQGLLTVVPRCSVCGLDLKGEDSGDAGPVFLVLVLGAIFVGLALWVEFRYEPPLWVHAVVWLPLLLGLTVALLRPIKALAIALQYRYRSLERNEDP